MTTIRGYHRPETVAEALDLLGRDDVVSMALGGGTTLNGLPAVVPDEVVDLQSLGWSDIEYHDSRLKFGSMTTLTSVVDHEMTPATILTLARREAPNTIRNAATVGGRLAVGHWESAFLAGLIAYEARTTLVGPDGLSEIDLPTLLTDRSALDGRLIESVSIVTSGRSAWESTQRTGADASIVAVVGRLGSDGVVHLAASGIASTPVVFDREMLDRLDPPSDFRGSAEYRRHLADVLSARVLDRLKS